MEESGSWLVPEPLTPEAPIGPFGAVARSSEHPDVLVLVGEIDVAVAQEALAELSEWTGVLTADMSGVTFLDSAGMRLVVRLARQVRPHRLRVVVGAGQALDTLHHFGAEQLVEIVEPAPGSDDDVAATTRHAES